MRMNGFVCGVCGQLVATRMHTCKPDPYFESNSILRKKVAQYETGFKILLEAAKKVGEEPDKAAQIIIEALKKVEKGKLHFDPVTRRRLEDGERALDLPLPKTKEDAKSYVEAVHQGAAALQSLDDLGSVAANKKAWADMVEIERRAKKVKKQFKLK